MANNEVYWEVIDDFPSFEDIPYSMAIFKGEIIKIEKFEIEARFQNCNFSYGEVINAQNKRGVFPRGFTKEILLKPTSNIYYKANGDFTDPEEGELQFKSGEIMIYLKPIENFSFLGSIGDKKGIVAFSFVEEYSFPSLIDEFIYLNQYKNQINKNNDNNNDKLDEKKQNELSMWEEYDDKGGEEEDIKKEVIPQLEIEPLPKYVIKTHQNIDRYFNLLFVRFLS